MPTQQRGRLADLLDLREKIARQRMTIQSLKREGHECADAERQLTEMMAKLKAYESVDRRSA